MNAAFTTNDAWAWDDKQDWAAIEAAYLTRIHEEYLTAHPEFKPVCDCHRKEAAK
jgi:hypothetical protein